MSCTIDVDYHVHIGQFRDIYYQPYSVVEVLYKNGIKEAWISSTSSCIDWSTREEKNRVIDHIEAEIEEALSAAQEFGIKVLPLYWVIPQRYKENESIESIMNNSHYKGFKLHPKMNDWEQDPEMISKMLHEVCAYADKYNLPILIHTGYDAIDTPSRIEEYFSLYSGVKFILAHCKATEEVIELFSKYDNVFGDTAFCPSESYTAICRAGFKDKMLFGTDFPITHWFDNKFNCDEKFSKDLSENYRHAIDTNPFVQVLN